MEEIECKTGQKKIEKSIYKDYTFLKYTITVFLSISYMNTNYTYTERNITHKKCLNITKG